MTIRAITEILQDVISTRCVKSLGGNNKKPKYPYVNKAFLCFNKVETHSNIRPCPTILYSLISEKYIKYLRRIGEITLKLPMNEALIESN
jgi:hypothetical protein